MGRPNPGISRLANASGHRDFRILGLILYSVLILGLSQYNIQCQSKGHLLEIEAKIKTKAAFVYASVTETVTIVNFLVCSLLQRLKTKTYN